MFQDQGRTGRLEVTAFFKLEEGKRPKDKKEGIVIHSKSNGHGYGYDNWPAFEARLKAAVEAQKWYQ